ncbi:MAG: FAD-binding domain-containing protein [Pelagibacteraceae bacterium]|tara:strand:+ start:55 stop:1191 length:1137 start_codon:yes stop_codon:yes gene_type:complete
MNFETSRLSVLNKLNSFIENDILNYNSKRNFDFGVKNRNNVSCLSPYITHRLISEYETIKKVLLKHPFQKVDKYIQEIFWRIYWKGWLELRPKVWSDFIEDLKGINEDDNYKRAINGETQIKCFNDWVTELKENNYLHNHTRMWFASIWIFTLNLPWQKGAEFFMKNLLDGDAASNTLSWRWVAGLQTKGKHYVAQSWNIDKFTNNKYQNVKLNEKALPITDIRDYELTPLGLNFEDNSNENLITFENELNLENRKLKDYKNIYLILLSNDIRKIKLEKKIFEFKSKMINDQKTRLNQIQVYDEIKFQTLIEKLKYFDVIYPCVGENYSYLNSLRKKHGLKLNFILRDEDRFAWQFSNKGFFNFKNHIPKIISNFNLH